MCCCNCLNFQQWKGIWYFSFICAIYILVFIILPLIYRLECSSQTRIWRSSWSHQSRILWNRTEGDDDQDWRRINFIYFEKCVVHIWAPFFCGPVSPCIHVPVVGHSSTVTSRWLGVHWSNGDLQASWFKDIFWRVMGLSRNLNMTISLWKFCPNHHSSSFSWAR